MRRTSMIDGQSLPESTLVGRQRELDRLWNLFEESLAGRLLVALVAGEPGIGKTRLLEEVADRAEQRGALVLRGGACAAEGCPLSALSGGSRRLHPHGSPYRWFLETK